MVDARLRVFAYELLFRAPGQRDASGIDHDLATCSLLLSAFVDGGPEDVADGKLAFINAPAAFVLEGGVRMLPSTDVIVEIEPFDDRAEGARLAATIAELRDRGYRFCLDHYDPGAPDAMRWLGLVDFVKLDMQARAPVELASAVREAAERAGEVTTQVLASRVETYESFTACRDAGALGFQGYFLNRPQIVDSGDIRGTRRGTIQSLSSMALERQELESTIRRDPVITYRLLRIANSSYYNRGAPARSIRRALDVLGVEGVKQWLTLLAMANIEGKPRPLLDAAMIRGRVCEQLAVRLPAVSQGDAFLVGMFSLLDALMDRPMADLLARLPVSHEIRDALLERRGVLGELLEVVVAQEVGTFDKAHLERHGIARADVQNAYLQAIRWAREMGGLMAA